MRPIAASEFVSAVYVFVSLISLIDRNDKSKSHAWLSYSLHAVVIYLVCDACAYSVIDPSVPFALRYTLNLISYCAGSIVVLFYMQYIRFYIAEKTELRRFTFLIPTLLLIHSVIDTIIEFVNGRLIVFEDGVAVTVNDLPLYVRCIQLATIVYILIVAASKYKSIGKKSFLLLNLFTISPVISSIVAIFTGFDIMAICGASSLILVASIIQNDEKKMRLLAEEERKRNQVQLVAEASNKAKSEFLFNMSHDIRTPMNAIIGFTSMAIRHRNEPEVLDESLEKLESSCDYLLGLVNNILDMARIESGKLELDETLSYSDSARHTLLDVFTAEAAAKDITLHTSYNIQDRFIWMDEIRTNQIIANLLSNAIKYTDAGGEIWYSVKQTESDQEGKAKFIISVKDNGRGMSAEFLEKIYNTFEREKVTSGRDEQGSGLGMAIVKKLVDLMGGSIDIQSTLGEGTLVTLTAYHRIASEEEKRTYEEEHNMTFETEMPSLKDKNILLVDDNDFNREIAIDILVDQGALVDEAVDGQNAIDVLRERGPDWYDLVLMDIQMPVMNGYDATREIRRMFPRSNLPIIALSANAFAEDRAKALESGMNEHIAKPVKVDDLLAVLSRILR